MVGFFQRVFELRQPVVGSDRNIVRLVEHARFLAIGRPSGAFPAASLYPFSMTQKGRGEISDIRQGATGYVPNPAVHDH
jgi:hypothetical protein